MNRSIFLPIAAAFLMFAISGPAQAQTITFDPTSYAKLVLNGIQSAWAAVSNNIGQIAQSALAIQNTNSLLAGARGENQARFGGEVSRDYYVDSNYSACAHMKAAMAAAYQIKNGQQLRMALARGGTGCTSSTSNNATNIKTRMLLGLAPCSTNSTNKTDPDYASYQNFKCTQQWGGRWEGTDQTMEALFSTFNLLVPPNFVLPINGVCQPLQPVTDEKYMPFIAAYSYCNSINPQVQPTLPPTGITTVSDLTVNERARARADMSAAYSMCMALLEERMQYDGSQTVPAFINMHASQSSACDGDNDRNWYDTSKGDCAANGRSMLQRRFDLAYRHLQAPFRTKYMANIKTEDLHNIETQLQVGEQAFEAYREEERQRLTAAINAVRFAHGLGASPDSQPMGPH